MSKFSKQIEQQQQENIQSLVISLTGFVPPSQNFETAVKFVHSYLQANSITTVDPIIVQSQFDGILTKLQIMSNPQVADFLNQLFQALKKCMFRDDYPDIPYRLLYVLMQLSNSYIEANQTRKVNYSVLQRREQNQVVIQEPDPLGDWEFESSSEEDEDVEIIQTQNNGQQQEQQNLPQSQKNNILWHVQPQAKKNYLQFSQEPKLVIRSEQVFQSENQNSVSQILALSDFGAPIKCTEVDVVNSILMSLMGYDTEIIKLQDGYFEVQNVEVPHISKATLKSYLADMTQISNILQRFRKPQTQINNYSLLKVDELVQTQMWCSIDEILQEFNKLLGQIGGELVSSLRIQQEQNNLPYTLIRLRQSLDDWFKIIVQINIIINKLENSPQKSTFSSTTLQLLYDACHQQSLQSGDQLIYIQQVFIKCLNPYIKLIDQFLNYDSIIKGEFINVPKFIEPCIESLESMGQAFKIFSQTNYKRRNNFSFRQEFYRTFEQLVDIPIEEIQKSNLKVLQLSGQFKFHEPFSIMQTPLNKTQLSIEYNKNLHQTKDPRFIQIFPKEFYKLVKSFENNIQQELMLLIFQELRFKEILQFTRIMFFFQRCDIMQLLVDELPTSQTLAQIKSLQNQLQEQLHIHRIYTLPYELMVKQSNKNVIFNDIIIKIAFPNPIDQIMNENTIFLYNRIFTFLLKFKNCKSNLFNSFMDFKSAYVKNNWKQEDIGQKMLQFFNQLMQFTLNYEYFLFSANIEHNTNIFLKDIEKISDFKSLIKCHNDYIKLVSDKMLLNQKADSIYDAISQIINIASNFPILVNRYRSLGIIDKMSQKYEQLSIKSELEKITQAFMKQIEALVLLFDRNQRSSQAPEIIECISKINFNSFYDNKRD